MRLSRILCRSEAEADNADRGQNNSDIPRKPNSIILLLFIPQEKSAMRIKIKTDKNLTGKFLTPNTRAPYGHEKYDIYLSGSKRETYFVCAEIRIIICKRLTNENTGIPYSK